MAPTVMMTEKDMIAGTPEYMSPEQWEVSSASVAILMAPC